MGSLKDLVGDDEDKDVLLLPLSFLRLDVYHTGSTINRKVLPRPVSPS